MMDKYFGVGVGFKPEHFKDIMQGQPDLGFFEVHAENYMGDGGAPHRMLGALRENYQLSVHGVGLSLGTMGNLDQTHLHRLKDVVDRYQPALVSEHLAWSSHDEAKNLLFLNDLLPIPYTAQTLDRVVEHVDQVQTTLGRQILVENPSTYVAFSETQMSEIDFITQMQSRTGCGLILDVNNVYISANNQNMDAFEYLDAFPTHAVGEIHLAGHAEDLDDEGKRLLIDAHDRKVAPDVWTLYQHVIAKTGEKTTLIEWDNDVPDWPTLYQEALDAKSLMAKSGAKTHAAE
ncbi:MNIO family bufferin maturase [Maritalea sp.]|uniref:MNIO family bufferin maturase n=1 Tax=Maritalea sp. TaxID=2003361 RepID=UPI003EF677F5